MASFIPGFLVSLSLHAGMTKALVKGLTSRCRRLISSCSSSTSGERFQLHTAVQHTFHTLALALMGIHCSLEQNACILASVFANTPMMLHELDERTPGIQVTVSIYLASYYSSL